MLRSTGRTSAQPSPSSQDPAFSTTPEVRRLNPTRSLRRITRPRRLSAQKELAGAAPPDIDTAVSNGKALSRFMNQSSINSQMGALGTSRKGLDIPNQHQIFSEASSNHTVSDYSFPPLADNLSDKEKQQNKQMEELDTIVVRGRDSTGTIGEESPQSISQNSSIIASSPASGKRSSRNSAIGAPNGGNSGRSSRNSDGRNVTGINSSLRKVKTNNNSKNLTGSATGHLESNISGSRDAAGISQLPQSLPQYSPSAVTVPSSMMEYNASAQNSANSIPNGPQEGIMKMETESNLTPQWSETKTKVLPSTVSHHYTETNDP